MAAPLMRRVMDMTNCANPKCGDPGLYTVDVNNTWFTVPDGAFRDAIEAHPNHMICVWHRKTEAKLYNTLARMELPKGVIEHAPGGYKAWRTTAPADVFTLAQLEQLLTAK